MTVIRWIVFALCSVFTAAYAAEERPIVLVSVAAYEQIVQEMAGPEIDVRSVVPAGMSFHTFEPTPRCVQTLSLATLWFTIGEMFESRILAALHSAKKPPIVVDLREGLRLLNTGEEHCCHGDIDTHIWTSPRMMGQQLLTIRTGLIATFPTMKEGIEQRFSILKQRIDALIAETDANLSGEEGKIIVIAHGAYGYLCHDFGIEQRAIEVGGKEATAKHLLEIVREAQEKGVKTVFSLKQYPRKGVERVAETLGATVVELDAYQADYFSGMSRTVEAFHKALEEERK